MNPDIEPAPRSADRAPETAQIDRLQAEVARLTRENTALRRSEARLRQMVDALPALVGYVDLGLRIVFANRMIEQWYQRPREQLLGMRLQTLFSPEHYRAVAGLLQQVLSGQEVDEEREITYPDGVTRRVHLNYVPDIEDGRTRGYFFLVSDVSPRYRAEEALKRSNEHLDQRVREATQRLEMRNRRLHDEIYARRASEERYRVVSELMSDLVYSYHIFADGSMTVDWSAGRLSREFPLRETHDGHHTLWRPIIHPQDRDILARRIRKLMTNEPSVDEFRVIDSEGRTRWMRVYGQPHWDATGGRVERVTVAARDITRRREAERRFEAAREHLYEALESMSDGFMLFDPQQRLVAFNDKVRELFPRTAPSIRSGVTFEELLRVSASSGEVKDAIGREAQWVAERMAAYPSLSGALEVELSNGRWVLATDRPTRAGGVVGLRADITERKREEEAMRVREAELAHVLRRASMGEMASALAHEISQPLAVIVNYGGGCLRRLDAGDADPQMVHTAVEKMCSAAERAKSIVNHVGDFVRRSVPAMRQEHLGDLIESVCALAESALKRNGVQLDLVLPADAPSLMLNRVEIEQVIFNLIRNGIDAMRAIAGGTRKLTLACTCEPGAPCRITVSDTGEGVAPSLGQNVFEPYVTSKESGLGMGLSISRTIVEAHGGRLWFTPNAPCGTAFHFTLPTAAAESA